MVSSPRARHGIENKKFLIVLRLLFMQNRGKDFYVELRLYCDSDARTRRRRLKRLFFFGGKVRSGTNGQGRWYACVLRRSKPSPNHLSCQLFLLVDYSWGLLFTTRMINDVRREAHVYMCNPFSFALACKYMKAIACWVEIGSTDAIWSCLFERREIFHFKARWLKRRWIWAWSGSVENKESDRWVLFARVWSLFLGWGFLSKLTRYSWFVCEFVWYWKHNILMLMKIQTSSPDLDPSSLNYNAGCSVLDWMLIEL